MNRHKAHVVVGVIADQPTDVISTAATVAERFNADLICVWVDGGRYEIGERPDGSVISLSLNPDLGDEVVEVFDPAMRSAIAAVLEDRDLSWSVRALAGGPAQELARIADELDAAMIVVGTRAAGFQGSVHEFLNGSVAAQLAHRQHRPVLVVPLNPVGDGTLPWNDGEL